MRTPQQQKRDDFNRRVALQGIARDIKRLADMLKESSQWKTQVFISGRPAVLSPEGEWMADKS